MNPREFFWLVAEMRDAQRRYFKSRDRKVFIAARALEDEVDAEIKRVKQVLTQEHEQGL